MSLAEVAKRAGVSLATASRVASGSAYRVSPDTRARVESAVRELAYVPNPLARALATKKSRTVGVIVGAITDPYFAEIAQGVEDYARGAGFLTVLCNADRNPAMELAYVRLLAASHVSGIIFAGGAFTERDDFAQLSEEVRRLTANGVEVVTLMERRLESAALISIDNVALLHDLTRYLIDLGHRRLVLLTAPAGFSTSEQRLAGARAALDEAGLEPHGIYQGGFDYDSGRSAALQVIQGPRPDAIVAFNDESALGVLSTLQEAGVSVPGDISVVGVDDTRDARLMGLTSVAVPTYAMGAAAARLIVGADGDGGPRRVIMPHRIVARTTTAPRA